MKAVSVLADASQHTWIEIKRSKFTYCIGCCSVFLVVVLAAAAQTLISRAPLIFLREAEAGVGQVDFSLTAASGTVGRFVNYTGLSETLSGDEKHSYHAPRIEIFGQAYRANRCRPGRADATANPALLSTDTAWAYRDSEGVSCGTPGGGGVRSCLRTLCNAQPASLTLLLADSAREVSMGYGREWKWKTGVQQDGIVLHSNVARTLNVRTGDVILVTFQYDLLLRHAFRPPSPSPAAYTWPALAQGYREHVLPLVVIAVVNGWAGKAPGSARTHGIVEFSTFLRYACGTVHPSLRPALLALREEEERGAAVGRMSQLAQYATEVNFNLPPAMRIAAYSDSNYDTVRSVVAGFASRLLYIGGFTETEPSLPLLTSLLTRRFITLFLGILFDSLLLILFALSTVLIYSLLLINVADRQFEVAVRRMLGSDKPRIVVLLLVQALAYALPAWILGLALAQGLSSTLLAGFTQLSGLKVDTNLTPQSIGTATALALVIPCIAAVGPIATALGPSVREALDVNRPKASAVKYSVERADPGAISHPVVIGGLATAGFGFACYFVLPLALISGSLSLLLNLFILLILALLAGLVILALNLELIGSRLVLRLFAWWDAPVVQSLARANLTAHRLRNRKTVLMYALSIAFIVFISVAAEQQILGAVFFAQQEAGSPMLARPPTGGVPDLLTVAAVEAVARRWTGAEDNGPVRGGPPSLTGWSPPSLPSDGRAQARLASNPASAPVLATAWTTRTMLNSIRTLQQGVSSSQSSTADGSARWGGPGATFLSDMVQAPKAAMYTWSMAMYGVSPGHGEGATYTAYNLPGDVSPPEESSLSPTTQLYTSSGSQAALFSSGLKRQLGFWRGREAHIITRQPLSGGDASQAGVPAAAGGSGQTIVTRTLMRVQALMDGASFYVFSRTADGGGNAVVHSLPAAVRIMDTHVGVSGVPRVHAGLVQGIWSVQHAQALAAVTHQGHMGYITDRGHAAAVMGAPGNGSLAHAATRVAVLESLLPPSLPLPWSSLLLNDSTTTMPATAAATGMSAAFLPAAGAALMQGGTGDRMYTGGAAVGQPSDRLASAAAGVELGPSDPAVRPCLGSVGHEDIGLGPLFMGVGLDEREGVPVDGEVTAGVSADLDAALAHAVRARTGSSASDADVGTGGWSVTDISQEGAAAQGTVQLLNLFFVALQLVALGLCFFSLLASMIANIGEQKKEIGVLLALGLGAGKMVRVYTHEAFALTLSSCILGTAIGALVAWTFGQQQALFTSVPAPFTVPWGTLIVIMVASAVAALLAACCPATRLTRRPITSLLR